MKRMIITIGRQSGSSGRKVGELLAERLSLPLYGKAELQKIAEGNRRSDGFRFKESGSWRRKSPAL